MRADGLVQDLGGCDCEDGARRRNRRIDALDPGGFGALTITKSITLDGGGGQVASVLVAGTNGIVIAAGASDVVTLRNLRFNGLATGISPGNGLDGVRITSAGTVHLEKLDIFGFSQNGVEVVASSSINLTMNDCTITDITGLAGVVLSTTTGTVTAAIDNLRAWNVLPAIEGGANCAITVSNSNLGYGVEALGRWQVDPPST